MFALKLIAVSIVPLLVALFNLLVAGYALTAAGRGRAKLAFAAGPAGVGIWALAWFISIFQVTALESVRTLGTIGGFLAILGFAVDAMLSLDRVRARRIAIASGGAVVLAFLAARAMVGARYELPILSFGSRLAALVLSGATVWAEGIIVRTGDVEEQKSARWMLRAFAVTFVFCAGFQVAALASERANVDPLLFVILLSEMFALIYIVRRRVEVHVLLSRALTYCLLAIVVALVAALAFSHVGYSVEPVVVAVTVAIALMASALFTGLSNRLASGIERLLFPEQARLERALAASRGELTALKRRLERAEKLAIAGELAASVAHEIKNPLAPIRGYAQLLEGRLRQVAEGERAVFEKGLRIIREETDRIDARIGQLLQLARADKKAASSEESFDLNRVAIEAITVAEGEASGIRIVQRLDATLAQVAGNEDEMRGALLNLIKNAIEAMQGGPGKVVEVVTRRDEKLAIVEVIDEGSGLGEQEAERVFQAFFTTKQGGTGLGLAIARSAVEAAGGRIDLRPRPERRGAIAHIELPLIGATGEEARRGEPVEAKEVCP